MDAERKTLTRPVQSSQTISRSKRDLVLKAGYGARDRWWDVELFRDHPVFLWLVTALKEERQTLLENPPQHLESGAQRDNTRWRSLDHSRGERYWALLDPGKLIISVKNTGKRLFVEVYGTSHGWDASRFKIDVERKILQVHAGRSGSWSPGEQAWLRADGQLFSTMDENLWPFVRSLEVPPSAPLPAGRRTKAGGDDPSRKGSNISAGGLFRAWDLQTAKEADRATMWAVVLCRHRTAVERAFARLPDAILALVFAFAYGAADERCDAGAGYPAGISCTVELEELRRCRRPDW